MLALRSELAEKLRQAVARAEAAGLWPCGARPAAYALIDSPRFVGGNISWPGLRASVRDRSAWGRAAEALRANLELTPLSPVCWSGCADGFVNFSWTGTGREHILRRAAEIGAAQAPASALPPSVFYAVQRTLWLEKMAFDQLAESLVSPPEENWSISLTHPEEIALISGIERLAWAAARGRRGHGLQPVLSQAGALARAWGDYYERNTLLKGTAEQIRARTALSRALRAVLSSCMLS